MLAKAIPAYARLAVEAAAHEVYFRTRLTAGHNRRDVEAAWTEALKTTQRVELAVSGNGQQGFSKWTRRQPYRQRTMTLCGRDVHAGMRADARDALADVQKTVDDLLGGRL